jgi:hypothetical protein
VLASECPGDNHRVSRNDFGASDPGLGSSVPEAPAILKDVTILIHLHPDIVQLANFELRRGDKGFQNDGHGCEAVAALPPYPLIVPPVMVIAGGGGGQS